MSRLRTVIVEDEPLARRIVHDLLARDRTVRVVGEAGSGPAGLELIRKMRPDLAFLDVEMPGMTGVDILRALAPVERPTVVFITAYSEFATDAFASLYAYTKIIRKRLPELHRPIRILQSKADKIISPVAANTIYEEVNSAIREIVWFQKSGHELMMDMESEQVFEAIMDFVLRFETGEIPTPAKQFVESAKAIDEVEAPIEEVLENSEFPIEI